MPTRTTHNHPLPLNVNSNPMSSLAAPNFDLNSYLGKILLINQHQIVVEDILGQGGFAFVFLVRSTHSNQQRYALKRMYVNNEHGLQVCQREIAILKEFSSHSNIVKYVDSSIQRLSPPTSTIKRHGNVEKIGENNSTNVENDPEDDDDVIYEILLLTEYCSNGALTTRLNEQRLNAIPLQERQILRIFADLCNAVSVCHHRRPHPILHRDIKLENLLIDIHQSYLLCDFGSAIYLSAISSTNTSDFHQYHPNQLTTTVIQQLEENIQRYTTLAYRAPEMIDLYSRLPITLKADIWAMGCLLYKLMFNQMPFGESILAIQNGTFTIPDDMAQIYSRELTHLLRYILEIDLQKRPDIWQVSHLTYKLLGMECPIPNRCHSKLPDLSFVPFPLTESEYRHQRSMTLAAAKSLSNNQNDENPSVGTAVNPRERPRGIVASSASLLNFNTKTIPLVAPPALAAPIPPPLLPPPSTVVQQVRSSHQRSGSAAQLAFDDDFSQYPTHAFSLNNLPNSNVKSAAAVPTLNTPERNVSRARPSPPSSLSTATGFVLQQQLFPPPPPLPTLTSHPSHRRSASQTMSPGLNNPTLQTSLSIESNSSSDRRHSIDSLSMKTTSITQNPSQQEVVYIGHGSSDDDDVAAVGLETNLNKLKVHNHSTENVKSRESLILNEDDRLFAKTYTINSQLKSDDEPTSSSSSSDENEKTIQQKSKKKSQQIPTSSRVGHHLTTDETSLPSPQNKNLVKRLIERCSLQQTEEPNAFSTPYKRKDPSNDQMNQHNNNNNDDDEDERSMENNENADHVGFDQLINEDSDDDQPAVVTSKSGTGRFLTTRLKEQQYEHFQDSDDDDDDEENLKTSQNKNPSTKLFQLFSTNSKSNASQETKRILNEQNNQNHSSTFIDVDNPFLHAPFHHAHRSPTRQNVTNTSSSLTTTTTTNVDLSTSSFDPTSIVVGKRLSAFAPYQRQEVSTSKEEKNVFAVVDSIKQKLSHSESYPPGTSATGSSTSQMAKDVFINAPFKNKYPSKTTRSNVKTTISPSSSHSTSSSNSQLIDLSMPIETNSRRVAMGTSTNSTQIKPEAYFFHSDRSNVHDGHSSSEELTTSSSSSTKKRREKKKSNVESQEQHAYANLSFNDAILDEFL